MKELEQAQLGWTAKRELSKINYRIHTDAIRQNLIPSEVTIQQANIIYANEADVLNVAMFGVTAKMWRERNPELKEIFVITLLSMNLFVFRIWKTLMLFSLSKELRKENGLLS